MKQKNYTKPTAMVVKLQQPHLMAGSEVPARGVRMQNYEMHDVSEE